MSRTYKKVPTGSGLYGHKTEFDGEIYGAPCNVDYITVTAFSGASMGTNFMRVNLYDDTKSKNDSFINLNIPQGDDSETFPVFRTITKALHGVFTGSGSVTATIR